MAARVTAQRYLGTQTSYDLAVFGTTIEGIEVGTAARYPIGTEVAVALPPASCWAYAATEDYARVLAPR